MVAKSSEIDEACDVTVERDDLIEPVCVPSDTQLHQPIIHAPDPRGACSSRTRIYGLSSPAGPPTP